MDAKDVLDRLVHWRYTCITMKTATVRDLRNRFQQISRWLEQGESVQVKKRGKPFARVVPEAQAGRL